MGNIWKTSIENLIKLQKKSEFLPSLFNAPDNHWTSESDKEIAVNNDPISDDTTLYGEWWQDKPRNPDTWRAFISMFSKPLSKKDEMTVDSAYDPEMEDAESKAMGEEPLIEYQKGFYDPKKHDFPKNTTWDAPDKMPNQHEPYSPLPVTLDMVQNPENNDQNSPGGFPGRFCQKPKSIWFSNSGEITDALQNMFKNRKAAINSLTRDITADYTHAYWIDPNGKVFQVRGSDADAIMKDLDRSNESTHGGWVLKNLDMLQKDYGIDPHSISGTANSLVELGWTRIGDAFGTDWGITVNDTNNIPSFIDDVIAQFAPEGSIITVATPGSYGANYTFEWPVKSIQQTVNRIKQMRGRVQKQPVMAKKAELINFQSRNGLTFPVLFNPSKQEFAGFIKRYGVVRFLKNGNDIYLWDSNEQTHFGMIKALRALGYEDAENYSPKKGYASKSVGDKVTVEDMDGHWMDVSIDELLSSQLVMAKKAEIIEIGLPYVGAPLRVIVNPTYNEAIGAFKRTEHGLRYLVDDEVNTFIWNSWNATHTEVAEKLVESGYKVSNTDVAGFLEDESSVEDMFRALAKQAAITKQYALYIGGRLAIRTLTRQKALKTCQERFPAQFAAGDYEIKEEAYTLAKQASIEEVNGVKVLVNPSWNELANVARKLSGGKMFRGLIDPHTGNMFVWDGYLATHTDIIPALGLDIKYSDESPYCLYFNPTPLSITDALERQQEVKQGKIPRASSLKRQAGSYSSTYTDEQGEQFFNEQHYNNDDEEPYVNHDQRDFSQGFNDSPENTDSGIGWNKDETSSVCLLDQLQNPADRNYPPGMPDYSITFYEAMPADDGIIKGNPD